MLCPECGNEMEKSSKTAYVQLSALKISTTEQFYRTCGKCGYACSEDYVSGFWAGVRAANASIRRMADTMKLLEKVDGSA